MFKVILLVAITVSSLASAANYPDTRNLTCKQARNYVIQHSPVTMIYGENHMGGKLYASVHRTRFKKDCFPLWVQTLDSPSCYIGWIY